MTRKAVFVVGPTGVGKSRLALDLALRFGGEIVSADSMQVYRGLDKGTAKPGANDLARVPHHLIDVIDAADPGDFSAAEYAELARAAIRDIFARDRLPIICGGSGFYVHALLYDMDFAGKRADPALRGRLECELRTLGAQSLYERLIEKDPRAAGIVHPNNTKRVVRALERLEGGVEADGIRAFEAAGKAATEQFDPVILRAAMDRAALYALIEARVDAFLENGLESEVIGLLRAGVPPNGIALQGIGYREIVSCLNGEYDRNEAIRLIKRNTRHLAKRQETWFKRYENVHIIDLSDAGQAVAKATDILRRELRGQTGKIT